MEKAVILWASPHDMLEEQERELKELFGDGAQIVNIRDIPDIPNIFASPDDKAGLYELAFKFLTAAQRKGFSVVVQKNMAIRYMIKMFLKDLWVAWRTLEGLPVTPDYAEAKLGMKHGEEVNL